MNTRKMLHIILSCSLYFASPTPFPMAMAADKTQSSSGLGLNYNDVAGALGSAIDVVGKTILQSKVQQHQFNMMMLAMKNTQYPPQFQSAKFFPQCAITPAQMDMPINACQKISTATELTQAEMLSKLAYERANLMDQMTSTAQNTANPVGIQCLQDAKSKQLVAMEDKINSLKSINNNIKKQNQLFRDNNKAVLEKLKETNDFLTGSKNSAASASMDVSKYFTDPACSEVLNKSSFDKGVRGVKDSMTNPGKDGKGLYDVAKNMSKDEASIKNQITTQKDRILKVIQNQGSAQGSDYLYKTNELTRGGLTSFPAVKAALLRKAQELQSTYTRIKSEIEKDFPGYKLPELDKHFSTNIGNFSKEAGTYFKKKMINDCVTMKDTTGLGLTNEQVLASLAQKSTGSRGTTTTSYKKKLNAILNADSFIGDKLTAIQALDAEFGAGNITVTIDSQGTKRNLSVYELYQEMVSRCEVRYTEDNTYSKDNANTSSQSKKVEQAQKYITELRDLEKNYASDLANEITDELINCTGKAKERSGSCDANRMDPANENFCVSSAVTCANNVKSCYQRAETIVKNAETTQKAQVAIYNQNVENLVAQHELFLKQIQAKVFSDSEFYKNYFPNSAWKMPDDLFVKLPEMSSGAGAGLGSELLRGGGTQDFLEDLTKKIESLQKVLEDQKIQVANSIDQYINAQSQAMENNKIKWKQIAETCFNAANGYREQVAKAQAKAAEQKAKEDAASSEFCSRYSDLAQSNPGPGCSGSNSPEKLYSDMSKVSASLDPAVQNNIRDYKELCAEIQSEKTSKGGENETEAIQPAGLVEMCDSEGNFTAVQSALIDSLLKTAPSDIAGKRENIEKFINSESADTKISDIVGSELAQSAWAKAIIQLKSSIKKAKTKAASEDVCSYLETKQNSILESKCAEGKRGKDEGYDQCVDRVKEKNQGVVDYDLKGLNSAITKINKSSTQGDVAKRWSEIGERWGSACKAGAGSTYQNRFLGEFQKGLSSGGGTFDPGSTIQNLQ